MKGKRREEETRTKKSRVGKIIKVKREKKGKMDGKKRNASRRRRKRKMKKEQSTNLTAAAAHFRNKPPHKLSFINVIL